MSESNEIYEVAASVVAKKNAATMPGPVGRDHFPLASAYLCQDCNAVGNNSVQCPACASEVLLGLSGVLNREDTPSNYSSLMEDVTI